MRSQPLSVPHLESLLVQESVPNALAQGVASFLPPRSDVIRMESSMLLGLPFDDEINADIATSLFSASSMIPVSHDHGLQTASNSYPSPLAAFNRVPLTNDYAKKAPAKKAPAKEAISEQVPAKKVPAKKLPTQTARKVSAQKVPVQKVPIVVRSSTRDTVSKKFQPKTANFYFIAPTLVKVGDVEGRTKVAAFDMDSTLITTRSGARFPLSEDDWQWLYPNIPGELSRLYNEEYSIIIFTNQHGVSKGNVPLSDITNKIQNMSNSIQVPIEAYIATSRDGFRKPNTGMWEAMKKLQKVDKENSFFVGDAAGRPARDDRKKDFSCDDRKFASNVGVTFYTESEFFCNVPKEHFTWGEILPTDILSTPDQVQDYNQRFSQYARPNIQEMILNIGPPASGKSTFTKKFLIPNGYMWINQDTYKTAEKCYTFASQALADKRSVAIDNTNPDRKSREKWITLAKQYNIPVRVLLFDTPLEVAHHLNKYREKLTDGQTAAVPEIAYAVFKSRYEAPELSEGIQEITKVPFVVALDNEQEQRRLFNLF
eukprot:TRINITY_DN1005_c0_g1_i2.p1 TRINITY_DN1005_c0_g1~~TRINITY_DN1005_c0_g1_i2.p1  ORF type:complete len:542 (+),score=105.58 TRINITY_DN1005_c0_g1_i2:2337-3962(+)